MRVVRTCNLVAEACGLETSAYTHITPISFLITHRECHEKNPLQGRSYH